MMTDLCIYGPVLQQGTKPDSVFACLFLVALIQTHPEVNAHSGDEAASQESSVFKTDQ